MYVKAEGTMRKPHALAASGTAFEVLWESYCYPPGAASATPRHVHETYQICLSLNFPGESRYRGATLAIPTQSISLFHPGEPHSSRDPQDRDVASDFRLLYVPAAFWEGSSSSAPFFPDAVMVEPTLLRRLVQAHAALREIINPLRTETILRETLHALQGFARVRPDSSMRREASTVCRVRRYLEDNAHEKVRLSELSGVARLSEYHLLRVFRQEVGMPPHAYQTQIRIDRARRLLLKGSRIGDVAFALGFADQSHFTRTFHGVVGCTPRQYIRLQ